MDYVDQVLKTAETYIKPQGVKILSLVGLLYATTTAFSLLRSFSRTFLLFGHNLPQRYGPGSWAVITGAGRGIGAAFAEKLGSLGFNLVLIDIDEVNLAALALTIESKFPKVQVKTVAVNFADSFQEGFYDNLLKNIEGLDVSLLVNNVGVLTPAAPFSLASEVAMLNAIKVNTVPMTILSRRLIPSMLKRANRSGIINLSSVAAVLPSYIIPVYSATKAYVDTLSRMIDEDVREKIDVISVRPDAVSTQMLRLPKVGGYIMSSEAVANAVLGKIGRISYAHGHWRHEVRAWLGRNPTLNRYLVKDLRRRLQPHPDAKPSN